MHQPEGPLLMRRYLFPLLFGIVGLVILINLGLWQLSRAGWKEGMLAEVQAGIDDDPVYLPEKIDPSMKYLPVFLRGETTGEEILVLSATAREAGYQVISGFVTDDGRKIMVDRGFINQEKRRSPRPPAQLTIEGNLHWPDEKGSSTPEPNLAENLWFARDVEAMAQTLGTEPVLVVARAVAGEDQGVLPMPVGIENIPNNHLSYAAQWFMIAMAWAGMTAALIWRINRRSF